LPPDLEDRRGRSETWAAPHGSSLRVLVFATAERWPWAGMTRGDVGVAAAAASETGKRGRIMGTRRSGSDDAREGNVERRRRL